MGALGFIFFELNFELFAFHLLFKILATVLEGRPFYGGATISGVVPKVFICFPVQKKCGKWDFCAVRTKH